MDAGPRGVVLGPHEALFAELMWLQEIATRVPPTELASALPGLGQSGLPAVPSRLQQRILDASLLYGAPDTSALGAIGPRMLQPFLDTHGISFGYREWFQEVQSRHGAKRSPLRRREPLAETVAERFTHARTTQDRVDATRNVAFQQTPPQVIHAVIRILRTCGFTRINLSGEGSFDVPAYAHHSLRDVPWPDHGVRFADDHPYLDLGYGYASSLANGIHDSIATSISSGAPFLSSDMLGPAWVSQNGDEPQYEVVRAIFDLPDGPVRPDGFQRIDELEGSRTLASLRQYVDFVVNRVSTADANAVAEVRREAAKVARLNQRGRRLDKLSRTATYLAVPLGVAELYAGITGPGLALGVVGALSQGMTSTITHRNRNHWITI